MAVGSMFLLLGIALLLLALGIVAGLVILIIFLTKKKK